MSGILFQPADNSTAQVVCNSNDTIFDLACHGIGLLQLLPRDIETVHEIAVNQQTSTRAKTP